MSLRKRLRILWATVTQEWSERTCRTCLDTWWVIGPTSPSAPQQCAACESEDVQQLMDTLEQRFEHEGVA